MSGLGLGLGVGLGLELKDTIRRDTKLDKTRPRQGRDSQTKVNTKPRKDNTETKKRKT